MLISLKRAAEFPRAQGGDGAIQGFVSPIGSSQGTAFSPAHSTLSELNAALKCPETCTSNWLWFGGWNFLDAVCTRKSFVYIDAAMMHASITSW